MARILYVGGREDHVRFVWLVGQDHEEMEIMMELKMNHKNLALVDQRYTLEYQCFHCEAWSYAHQQAVLLAFSCGG